MSQFYNESWEDIEDWGVMDFLFKMNFMIDKQRLEQQEIKKMRGK